MPAKNGLKQNSNIQKKKRFHEAKTKKPDSRYPFSPSLAAYVHVAFVSTSYCPLFQCKPDWIVQIKNVIIHSKSTNYFLKIYSFRKGLLRRWFSWHKLEEHSTQFAIVMN